MAANSNNDSKVEITAIPPADIAEAIAASAPAREELAGGTVRETNTVYEDRTNDPTEDRDVDYEAETIDLGGGSTLTTYGAPVGGFSEAE